MRKDFASLIVDAVKSAIGKPATPKLRAVFILAAVIMLSIWGFTLIPVVKSWNDPRADGFQMIPVFYATLTLLPLGFFALAGGISGHGEKVVLARLSLIIAAGLLVLGLMLEILRRMSEVMGG